MVQVKTGIGQDSHCFDPQNPQKKLILGGVVFEENLPLLGNSDADVVLHAVTNAVSGITGVNIIGEVSDIMCLKEGITDSRVYLKESLKFLNGYQICHLSVSLECQIPKITPKISAMKQTIAELLDLSINDIGITATSGERLTPFGKGEGIQALAIVTAIKNESDHENFL